jgi:hypothetical protein
MTELRFCPNLGLYTIQLGVHSRGLRLAASTIGSGYQPQADLELEVARANIEKCAAFNSHLPASTNSGSSRVMLNNSFRR